MYNSFARFLLSLNISFISTLRDTQLYARVIEQGVGEQGVGEQEMKSSTSERGTTEWARIFKCVKEAGIVGSVATRPLYYSTDKVTLLP